MPISRFDLAQRIVERFRPRRGAPRRVAEVLLRRHRRLSARHMFNVGVTLHLHRHDAPTRVRTIERRLNHAAAQPLIALRQHTPPPAPFPAAGRSVEHVTLQRLLARELRRDTLTRDRRGAIVREPSPNPASAEPHAADPARPVEFVMRRAAPQLERDERGRLIADARPPVLASAPVIHGSTRPAAAAPTIPLSHSELARLTDDVVGAIERRFVAHRERRGIV
jgi:hypothetical protein